MTATDLADRPDAMPLDPFPAHATALDQARWFSARGLCVIPVPLPRAGVSANTPGDGKTPVIRWRAYQERLPTEPELRTWFATAQNLAVITGAVSGVVVVDADGPDALRWCTRRLAYTPWQTKTARGFHLWYAHPGVRVANRARIATDGVRLALDVRADGGFVIAPGSLHASGARYEFAGDWTVLHEALPRFWPGWLQRPARRTPDVPARRLPGDGAVCARAEAYLAAIPRPEIGQGSDEATFVAACRLVRGFGLAAGDAEALLWHWAGGRPGWTRAWIARKVASAERYGSEAVGGLVS